MGYVLTVIAKEETPDVHARIIDVARTILAEGGMKKLSMRLVAGRVGITATAIYHHFENKQALVDEVVTSGYRRFGAHMRDRMENSPEGSLEQIRAMGEAYIVFAMENAAHFRVIFNLQGQRPKHIDEIPGHGGFHQLRATIALAVESGDIGKVDPDLAALFLWTVVHGLVTLALACKYESACEHNECEVPSSPVELFNAFAPFIDGALRGLSDEDDTAKSMLIHKLKSSGKKS
jgi:AcrR family transcriptional regulator